MKVFDLSDDILEIVADEVFRWRKKNCGRELRWAWRRKLWSRKLVLANNLSWNRQNIHEGRVMLTSTGQEAMDLKLLSKNEKFVSKYFICGLRASPTSDYNFATGMWSYGISLKVGDYQIINMGLNNGWEDFKDQTDNTIVRYLMNKEQERKYY